MIVVGLAVFEASARDVANVLFIGRVEDEIGINFMHSAEAGSGDQQRPHQVGEGARTGIFLQRRASGDSRASGELRARVAEGPDSVDLLFLVPVGLADRLDELGRSIVGIERREHVSE